MNKQDLYKKLQNADPKVLKELKLTEDELKYIKEKLLNDKLGLTINFTEIDNEEKSNYILLEEEKELAINARDKNNHLLIEGDNYHALKALLKTNIKVDVIYIDPPYNTGKEFVYKDDFGVDKVVGSDDPHKHSKWLSFMKKRLELAKELLSEEGVIFVSIDDNEQAYLKVLMDEIFGESCFIGNMIWQNRTAPNDAKTNFASVHEYIAIYSLGGDSIVFKGKERDFDNYKNPDNDSLGPWIKDNPTAASGNYNFGITNPFNKETFYPPVGRFWAFSEKRVEEWVKSGKLVFYSEPGKSFFIKKYKHELKKLTLTIPSIFSQSMTMHGTKELNLIFSSSVFDYPKPTSLIKAMINLINDNNTVILDFFAGSGTTGQAVIELNEEDGGNRRFILITNNEMKHETRDENLIKKNGSTFYIGNSSKDAQVNTLDFPEYGIARAITRERLFRVINGEGSQGEKIEWKYSDTQKSLKNNSVKYLKTKLLNKIEGEFEEIDAVKELYENEFDKEISITDFKE